MPLLVLQYCHLHSHDQLVQSFPFGHIFACIFIEHKYSCKGYSHFSSFLILKVLTIDGNHTFLPGQSFVKEIMNTLETIRDFLISRLILEAAGYSRVLGITRPFSSYFLSI